MGVPKWKCPSVLHVKIKVGPNWDQHGNAQVGIPRLYLYENKDGSRMGPTWKYPSGNATLDPLGAQVGCKVGPTWAARVGLTTFCPVGPHGAAVGLPMCDTWKSNRQAI